MVKTKRQKMLYRSSFEETDKPALSTVEIKKILIFSSNRKLFFNPLQQICKFARNGQLREMAGSFNREYTEILIQKRRYGYKTCLDGMLFWKGRFSNRTAQTVIGWRVLQELLASLDAEDFSEENRQITFFD